MSSDSQKDTAHLIVECLEGEGVKYVFGIPGEENIHLVDALNDSKTIEFVLTRHEQGASFMASTYGRLTGMPGVCLATLGPGAINLMLGVADAETNSTPLVALSAQGGLARLHKESHQVLDLVSMFKPVTQYASMILTPRAVPEMIRKAFSTAKRDRPGAAYLAIPQDVEEKPVTAQLKPLKIDPISVTQPTVSDIDKAVKLIAAAKNPIILAGDGVLWKHAEQEVQELSELLDIPVVTTFMSKGVLSDRHKNALGVVGFMRKDYENFAIDRADMIISIGFSIQQFDPQRINPHGDKKIIHINMFRQDVDSHYPVTLNIIANIRASLQALLQSLRLQDLHFSHKTAQIRELIHDELISGQKSLDVPLKPQTVVYATRKVLPDDAVVLVDTGAVKMWMARLYQTYLSNTCLIDNGLSTMAWTLPGAIGAKLARPDKVVVAVMGDGSFLMNSQEIETAIREKLHLIIVIWEDASYGLIKWKMDMEIKHHNGVDFDNPDFVKYAESFGAHGRQVEKAGDFSRFMQEAVAAKTGVYVIAVPVDYRENMKLISKLGNTTMRL
ncbi:acetolactate synthase large subunit [Liquorilactobacillus satsumensis]|uniref:Acetolactate synthase, large subunit n=1 Tax=Liquorilactobacillus satsumensis DSM 16230 = JCM 12392 TaxID=1423801 RepID=A0A0R1UYH8_9LACO|nr:acetolactate synthase large subunit [Liquorilactobacillus satsumensis]KRL97812.1 acetolactate synthase, large subunit [Liquorilactobacillus satsumensis DSM 16230 = JCM 12392]MCC7666125.1 acetolactate synthase large subunit [Liquorilactobacillus satsumensis]MCP9313781.1 acetolactate synthase large subunit [Liquorilactobacillus satsumensis]MCP9329315.1 acetolactate synthase large subunit [Liquorilactobacillus satsumensis]MCP9357392.1 acetolactate synthase large subunit [Liquorilactobacillus s